MTSLKIAEHRRSTRSARDVLEGRLLTIVGKNRAVFDLVDVAWGGVVLTGVEGMKKARRLGRLHPDTVLLAEPPMLGSFDATPDEPFAQFITEDTLLDMSIEDYIDQQATIVDVVILPAGHVAAGQRRALQAVVTASNAIERDNVVLVLMLDPRWLLGPDLLKLIHWVKQCVHPVAVAFSSTDNPLGTVDLHRGYRRLFAATGAFAWRADHAGLDAFAHGAMGVAIGVIPSLRKATPPGEDNHAWNPKDKRPHMAHPTLLRYVRTSELEGWYVNHPYNCGCFECYGRPIYRLGASEADRAEGERHNAIDISGKFDNLRKLGDKPAAWRRTREEAVASHRQLSIETSREHPVEAGLRHWEQLDAEEAAQPSEQPAP